jgi:hypothetical protein
VELRAFVLVPVQRVLLQLVLTQLVPVVQLQLAVVTPVV